MSKETNRSRERVVVCNGPCFCCDKGRDDLTRPAGTWYYIHVHPEPLEESDMALPKRSAPSSVNVPQEQLYCDPEFKAQYPSIHSFISDGNYDDGSRRLTGTLSIFVKNGRLTCGVNDNDRLLTAYVNAVTIEELLFTVDEGIRKDNLEWKSKMPAPTTQKPPY